MRNPQKNPKPMRNLLKFLLSLTVALLLMMAFRTLVFTVYSVDGDGLEPIFTAGDRVMVNRWSYGLRTGGNNQLFGYGRICHQQAQRGDIVAYEDPTDSTFHRVLFGRIRAPPGDTIRYSKQTEVVPSLHNCADGDYFWIQAINEQNPLDSRQLGFISEQRIIGRACMLVFSHEPGQPFWKGYRKNQLFLMMK